MIAVEVEWPVTHTLRGEERKERKERSRGKREAEVDREERERENWEHKKELVPSKKLTR